MRKVLAILCFLALPGQSELQHPQSLPPLPPWATLAPSDIVIVAEPILDVIDSVAVDTWTPQPTPFSDWALAAILSRTTPRS